jgi:hypothetical protein
MGRRDCSIHGTARRDYSEYRDSFHGGEFAGDAFKFESCSNQLYSESGRWYSCQRLDCRSLWDTPGFGFAVAIFTVLRF